ncbi:hypothetical protein OUM_0061 [Helicobacter pylori R038b]|uniref:Uncharacterized protein n=1 Tax=Helicobacter pylori R038b TaxID=1145115 RepID=K2LDS6_HELPX|nr:hypothetical protein OUM_0061 [Helicobacter pylori R038b]
MALIKYEYSKPTLILFLNGIAKLCSWRNSNPPRTLLKGYHSN